MSNVMQEKQASVVSVNYLETLWRERTDIEFPRADYLGSSQERVSRHIDAVLKRTALPSISEELMDEIKSLAAELGESYAPRDRAQAARIVVQLRDRVRRRRYREQMAAAESELEAVFGPALDDPDF